MAAFDTTYNPGDILLGFKTVSGTGATTNIIVNLGSATTYRDASGDILNIGNIGSLLSSTYGANWADSTGLFMGAITGNNSNPTDNSGSVGAGVDPNSTAYLTARRNVIGTAGVANSTRPGNNVPLDGSVQPLIQQYENIALAFLNQDTDSNGIVEMSSATTNGWSTYVTGTTGSDFSTFNIERGFAAGSMGTFGAAGSIENAIDLYRMPEFATQPGQGEDGRGEYLGTFTIDSAGNISFIADFTAVPEPSTALGFGLVSMLGLALRRNRKVAVA